MLSGRRHPSDYSDSPIPSQMFTSLACDGDESPLDVTAWAEKNIGDTHLGKRKSKVGPAQKQRKKGRRNDEEEEEEIRSEDTTPEPTGDDYNENNNDDDDDDDTDDGGSGGGETTGGTSAVGGSSGGHSGGRPIRFTGESHFTHATQDEDHGAPTSQRQTRSYRRQSTPHEYDSSSSLSSTSSYPAVP